MKFFPALLITVGIFWLAAVLDTGAGLRLSFFFGSRPEFGLALAAAFTVASRPAAAAACGFLAGLFAGALSGANLTQYVLSAVSVCFIGASLTKLPIEQRWWIVYLEIAGIVLATRLLFMFMAPPPQVAQYAAASAFSALVSAAIGLAVYPLARRIFGSKEI